MKKLFIIPMLLASLISSCLNKEANPVLVMDETEMHMDDKHVYVNTVNEDIKDSLMKYFPTGSAIINYDSGKMNKAYYQLAKSDTALLNRFFDRMNKK